jgi:hypothetical protein
MTSALWTLYEPDDPAKKWAVRVPSGSGSGSVEVKFGARGYEDFTTHKDVDRRERYRTRHQHDRIDDPYSPGFWSWWALWGESDNLDKAFKDAVRRAKAILGDNMTRHNPDAERVAFSIIMGPAKGMKQRIIDFALRLSDDEVERVSTTFSRQGPAIWRYWSKALDERKKAGKGVPSWARENPVRETFDFAHYEEYARSLSNNQLHYAIEDARRALEVARGWNDGGAGEAKYSDQLGVLQQERRRRQSRSNPADYSEWLRYVDSTVDWNKYAASLSDDDLHKAIWEARNNVEKARVRGDEEAIERNSKYLDVYRQEQQRRGSRSNPEWAKSLGRGLYKGARYAGEAARDVYHGAKEAHSARSRENPEHPGFDQYDFPVSKSFVTALLYGDVSGLSPEDEEALDRFYENRIARLGDGHWAVIEDDAGFGRDVITGLGADRVLLAYMVPRE